MKSSTISAGRELAGLAYALHTAVERELHDTLRALDLSQPLADVIWHLDPACGSCSRRELAERLHCDPSNVTFLVDRLERKRLVTRAPSSRDRRVKSLTLTPTGRQVRERLTLTLAESDMFSRLTGAQRRQLVALLQRCSGPRGRLSGVGDRG